MPGINLFIVFNLLFLVACARPISYESAAIRPSQDQQVISTVDIALQQIGAPYRYGGHDPSGFDCSGLVYYAYHQRGMKIPRSTSKQMKYARSVSANNLRIGDLLFFRISAKKVSHVGIYIGDRQFVHAPSSGKRVQISSLNNRYWSKRFITAGRI